MKLPTAVALGLAVAGLVAFYGFWDSHAESEPDVIGIILNIISDTQSDIDALETRMAEVEAVDAELMQRIGELERRLDIANATTNATEISLTVPDSPQDADTAIPTNPSCGPGYWLNMDTNACERIQEDGPPSCGPGYWLNMDTNACERIQEDGPPSCGPGYWLNMDTNACERIQDDPAGG